MIGADQAEIALVKNTTEGISLVAEGLPWRLGDNVVTLANEFPSNQYPWMNLADRGVEVRRVPVDPGRVDLDQVARACDDRTRVLTVSWVGFASGWRSDIDRLTEIAHDRGELFFLDAIQGLGVFEIDVSRTPVDFLAADGHKWLLGPEGAGIFYIRRENLEKLRPIGVGWHSVVGSHDFDRIALSFKSSATRFEGGTLNMAGFIGLGASLRLITSFRQKEIAGRVLDLANLATERLKSIGAVVVRSDNREHQSGIVSFEMPGRDPAEIRTHCLQEFVLLSCRGGRLRASIHGYNDSSDVDRLIDSLTTA